MIRVGGRLQNANIKYNIKHPIILLRKGHFTWLLIQQSHHKSLHGGCQVTLQPIRNKYWIIHGKIAVKNNYDSVQPAFDSDNKHNNSKWVTYHSCAYNRVDHSHILESTSLDILKSKYQTNVTQALRNVA